MLLPLFRVDLTTSTISGVCEPLLRELSEPLLFCLLPFARAGSMARHLVPGLLNAWPLDPSRSPGRSVVLLHCLERVIDEIDDDALRTSAVPVVQLLTDCFMHDFMRIADRALQ